MPDKTQITKIKKLARQGQSVNKIKDKLDLPKSTVYYHFKKEVGQKQKENQVKIPEENDEVIGEICGAFAGDGNFHKKKEGQYRIRIFLNLNDNYWKQLADFLEEKLEKRPNTYQNESQNRATLDYSSKKLYETFKDYLKWGNDKTKSIRLRDRESVSRKFKIGFVRGLLDTDGFKETKFRRYIYGTVSEDLRNDFSHVLDELNIPHTKYVEEAKKEDWKNMYKVRLSGDPANNFSREIKPRHPKKKY